MPKLNQILAIEKGIKARVYAEFTNLHQATQKPALMNGFVKTYQPKTEESETYPPESQKVQHQHDEVIKEVRRGLTELFDITATKDWANCTAKADIIVEGTALLKDVPATYLLFLEKQLGDLHTFVSKIVELDPGIDWAPDAASGLFKSDPAMSQRTKKEQKPIVLYQATDKHPAQTQLITEDVVVGSWSTVKMSGAIATPRKKVLVARIEKLLNAVKFAREQANLVDTATLHVADPLFSYIFKE